VNLAVAGLRVKVVTYRGYTGNIHWYDPSSWLTHLHPRVTNIVCVSDAVRRQIRKQLWRNKDKSITIYKGHDPTWYQSVDTYDLGSSSISRNNGLVIGCVANARPMKGIPVLLEAVRSMPAGLDWQLVLVGANMDRGYLARLIEQHPNRSKIFSLGFQSHVLPIIKTFDIMVLPSLKGEGLSKTTIEAMHLDIPVIVSNAGGNGELVEHEKSGIVVKAGDAGALRNGLIELMENETLRQTYAKSAKIRVSSIFHINQTVQHLQNLYLALS
jgi:glycosyltransferase involved in cell wall biosynthesis